MEVLRRYIGGQGGPVLYDGEPLLRKPCTCGGDSRGETRRGCGGDRGQRARGRSWCSGRAPAVARGGCGEAGQRDHGGVDPLHGGARQRPRRERAVRRRGRSGPGRWSLGRAGQTGPAREGKERRVGPGEGEGGVGRGKGWAAGSELGLGCFGLVSSLGFWAGLQGFGLGSHA